MLRLSIALLALSLAVAAPALAGPASGDPGQEASEAPDAAVAVPEPETVDEAPAPPDAADDPEEEAPAAPPEEVPELPEDRALWSPPAPRPHEYDWIRLNSGEWLKGDIEGVRDYTLYFDSDELDRLQLDWADIAEIHSPRIKNYRFRGREVVTGSARMQGETIRILTARGVVERHRDKLVAVVPSERGELDFWTMNLGIGVGVRSGNTEQFDFSGSMDLQRNTTLNRGRLQYNGAFSEVDGSTATNNHRALATLDFFITHRFFVTVPFVQVFSDTQQNIAVRVSPGVGVGYELLRRPAIEWDARGGVAAQHVRYDGETDDGRSATDAALIFGTELDLDVTDDIEFDQDYELQLVVTDLGKTNHHYRSTLSFDVWGPLDFDVSFFWDRVEDPAEDDDGDQPDRDDFRLTIGIGLEF